jgi:hypothetical protein
MTSGGPVLVLDVEVFDDVEPELLQAATPMARTVAAARAFTVL